MKRKLSLLMAAVLLLTTCCYLPDTYASEDAQDIILEEETDTSASEEEKQETTELVSSADNADEIVVEEIDIASEEQTGEGTETETEEDGATEISVVASGACGDDVTWVLDDAGTLTISGTGAMTDWTSGGAPWYEYSSSIVSVEIENGITDIGNYAFYYCSNMTDVTISDSVKDIGKFAFYKCSSLSGSIIIPEGVEYIRENVFGYCSSLTEIVLPDTVHWILEYAFQYCRNLTTINLPDNLYSIGLCAFEYCSSLPEIVLPESLVYIRNEAFIGCSSLTGCITIPDGVTYIASSLFKYCSNLTGVVIGNNVTEIYMSAFQLCTSLTGSITLPEGLTTIGSNAFSGCSSLAGVNLPDSLKTIESEAFSGCSSLTDILIPESVTYIEPNAFWGCSSLSGSLTIPEGPKYVNQNAFKNCSSLTSIILPNSVLSIGDWAFYNCRSLTEMTIPVYVTTIGEYAFYDCDSLTTIIIPDSVTTIEAAAFIDCDNLASITISDSVTSIDTRAFRSCGSLSDIYYTGSEDDWALINPCPTFSDDVVIHYNSKGKGTTSISLSKSIFEVNPGDEFDLTAVISNTVDIENAIPVSWSVSDEEALTLGGSSVSQSDEKTAVAMTSATVTTDKSGVYTITATTSDGVSASASVYVQADYRITLDPEEYVYKFAACTPDVTVTNGSSGEVLSEDEYTYEFSDNIKAGKAKVTVTITETEETTTGSFNILPRALENLEASVSGTTVTLNWEELEEVDGYEITYFLVYDSGEDSESESDSLIDVVYGEQKTVTVSGHENTTVDISDLENGQMYKFVACGYKNTDDETLYGDTASVDAFAGTVLNVTTSLEEETVELGEEFTVTISVKSGESYDTIFPMYVSLDQVYQGENKLNLWLEKKYCLEFNLCTEDETISVSDDGTGFYEIFYTPDDEDEEENTVVEKTITFNTVARVRGSYNFTASANVVDTTIEGLFEAVDSDGFQLERDGVSFAHSDNSVTDPKDPRYNYTPIAGFVGVKNYKIKDEYWDIFKNNLSTGDRCSMQTYMFMRTYDGACYGTTISLALVYNHSLTGIDLGGETENFYGLSYPSQNEQLLSNILLYQVAQSGNTSWSYDKIATAVASKDSRSGSSSLSTLLSTIVGKTLGDTPMLFTYEYDDGDKNIGHLVLLLGCQYNESENVYVVECYDVNVVKDSVDQARFCYMVIEGDFSGFDFVTGNGENISTDRYDTLQLIELDKFTTLQACTQDLSAYLSGSSSTASAVSLADTGIRTISNSGSTVTEESQFAKIIFPTGQAIRITNANGEYVYYDGSSFSGNMTQYDVYSRIDGDSGSSIMLLVDNTDTYEVSWADGTTDEDVEIYTTTTYLGLTGSNIESATLSFDEGILLTGDAYSFEAFLSTEDTSSADDCGLVSVSASAENEVVLTEEGGYVHVTAEDKLEDVVTTNYIGTTAYSETVDGSPSDLTVSGTDGLIQKELSEFTLALITTDYTYDGTEKKPDVTVSNSSSVLDGNTDYTVTYADNVNAGTATVTVTGKGNYTGTLSETFHIVKADQAVTATAASNTVRIGGSTQITANGQGAITYQSGNSSVATVSTNGTVKGVGAGTAIITISAAGNSNYNPATKSISITVTRASQTVTAGAAASSIEAGNTTQITASGKGTISYKSSDTSVATVDGSGLVTGLKPGTAVITVSAAGTDAYDAADTTVSIKVTLASAAISGLVNKSSGIAVTWGTVTGASGYYVYRKSGSGSYKLITTITNGLTVTYTDKTVKSRNAIKYTYKVVPYSGSTTGGASEKTLVRLTGATLSSVKNTSSKKITVKWKKKTNVSGYQVQYSTSKTFKSGNKTVKVSGAKKVSTVLSKLKKGKTYYVRIRTWKKVNGKTYYSAWSSKKSVKVKK